MGRFLNSLPFVITLGVIIISILMILRGGSPEDSSQAHAGTPEESESVSTSWSDGDGYGEEEETESTTGDPIKDILLEVVAADHDDLEEFATGRFLRDVQEYRSRTITGIDLAKVRCIRRGQDWVMIEAPLEVAKDRDRGSERLRGVLRFVKRDDVWSLENLRLMKRGG